MMTERRELLRRVREIERMLGLEQKNAPGRLTKSLRESYNANVMSNNHS